MFYKNFEKFLKRNSQEIDNFQDLPDNINNNNNNLLISTQLETQVQKKVKVINDDVF